MSLLCLRVQNDFCFCSAGRQSLRLRGCAAEPRSPSRRPGGGARGGRTRATAGAPTTTPRGAPATGTMATAATATGTASARATGATPAGVMLTETGSESGAGATWAGESMTRGQGNAPLHANQTAAAGRSAAARRSRQSAHRAERKSLPAGRSACAMTAPHRPGAGLPPQPAAQAAAAAAMIAAAVVAVEAPPALAAAVGAIVTASDGPELTQTHQLASGRAGCHLLHRPE